MPTLSESLRWSISEPPSQLLTSTVLRKYLKVACNACRCMQGNSRGRDTVITAADAALSPPAKFTLQVRQVGAGMCIDATLKSHAVNGHTAF